MRNFYVIFGVVALAGCQGDLSRTGTFEPSQNPGQYTWRTFADSFFPENSPEAEAARRQELAKVVAMNNACPNGYDVTSRQSTLKSTSAIGAKIHDVFYGVRCK